MPTSLSTIRDTLNAAYDLAPSLAALAYLHFCLESLRRLRGDAVLSISQGAK